MTEPDPRIEKLPAWARALITNLVRKADDARAELEHRRDEQPESDIWIEHGYKREDRQYIADPYAAHGMHLPVVFRLPSDQTDPNAQNTLSVRIKDGTLEVSATGYPHALTIRSQASNVVQIRTER